MTKRLLIDADGCPVVDEAVRLAKQFHMPCLILCDTSHRIEKAGAETRVFSKGADSVDFALVNLVHPGDVVITQDYGLAAMCLAKAARVLHQDGMEYTPENIDGLLLARHTAKKIRSGGGRLKGPKKRTPQQNKAFEEALLALLQSMGEKEESPVPWLLETPRLGFRRLGAEDADALRPILGDVETMYAWEYGFCDAQIAEWLGRCTTRYQNEGYAYFAAIEKATGHLVGVMGLLNEEIGPDIRLGVGYILAKQHWGKGLATEGATAWMNHAFETMNAHEVIADIRPENTASRKVAERLGMKVVGQHIKNVNGKEMMHLIYAKQRSEEDDA